MTDATEHRERKRGGQPGNTNALKHGFYARYFKPTEDADLESALLDGLQNEVSMLRVMIQRVVKLASNPSAASNFDTAISALNTLGAASTHLAGLLRMERLIGGEKSQITDVLSQALIDIVQEFKQS